ncbi:MAG TPA: DNA repair protein RecN [Bryobacteraceae bacterium]|jgi:DNA repair protein RecN (Recombination protein N)|nr:DNA repair protein RecN [Bryobacteraceae bacterium]
MLVELLVENYAVVDRIRVRFHPGLNLLTGETGSGKSIVVDAFGLLLGARASPETIRSGAVRARVAGIFDVRDRADVRALLDPAGIAVEDSELLVEREILAGGKSRAFVGSRPVAVSLLRELAPLLGDIHGQHDQQLLFSADAQRDMLDAFASSGELRTQIAEIHASWKAAGAALETLERTEQEKLRLLDLWEFQRKEIEGAAPSAGEDEALDAERRVLQNLGRLQENAGTAYAALYDSPEAALAQVRLAAKRLDDVCRIDPSLAGLGEYLQSAEVAIKEASYGLRDYLSGLEANPGRLEEIENRLALLDKLKRKYGASLGEVLVFLAEVRAQIEQVEHAGERMAELRGERERLAGGYQRAAGELTALRTRAARKLEKGVEAELASLAMERTKFRIQIAAAPWSPSGADRVEFLVSPNLGEEPKPLEKVASGGEISRIALALKTCLADDIAPHRTLVFDEVDAGIGGSAAEGVGRRLKKLAAANQVLCVTHLAQIAAFADHHYCVEKRESQGRTVAGIEELDRPGRTREVGRMLSGQELTPEALKHAERLIKGAS